MKPTRLFASLVTVPVLLLAACGGSTQSSSTPKWQSQLVHSGELTVATSGTAAPLTYVDQSGNLVGFWPDMTADIAKRLGLKLNLVKIDFSAILPGLAARRFDLGDGGISVTPARLASKTFIMSKPYLIDGFTAVVLKDSGIASWADMKGKKLGGATGQVDYTIVNQYLTQNGWPPSSTVLFPGQTEGFLGLTEHRIDGFGSDANVALYAVKTSPNSSQLTVLTPFISVLPEATAYPGSSKDLATKVDSVIGQLLSDGTVANLAQKWFGSTTIVDTSG
jgi:ABC-type amino acid transport substrate-binding protein